MFFVLFQHLENCFAVLIVGLREMLRAFTAPCYAQRCA